MLLMTANNSLRLVDFDWKIAAVIDQTPLGVVLWDAENRVAHCNPAAVNLFQLPDDCAARWRFDELSPPTQPNGADSASFLTEHLRGAAPFEFTHLLADGQLLPVEITPAKMTLAGQEFIAGYYRDNRPAKKMLAAQEAHEQELQLAASVALRAKQRVLLLREQELRDVRRAAEKNSKIKNEFLLNINHELRTPMNGVIGTLTLLKGTALTAQQQSYLASITDSANSLIRLIDDLLDIKQLENGELKVLLLPFNLRALVEQIRDEFAPQAANKGLVWKVEIDAAAAVIGDELRLRQILRTLLDNALKFTEKGGITLSVRKKSGSAVASVYEFTVRDTGIGFTPEQLKVIFQPFAQADTSRTRKYGGIGLGLSICRRLIEMMDGEIEAVAAPDGGAIFRFTVCLNTSVATNAETVASAARRLLLVDDNEVNMMVASDTLESMNYAIDTAEDGEVAVDKFRSAATANKIYDAILMDLAMPVMDGYAATRAIRKLPQGDRLPIIALSANARDCDRAESLAAGMDDHLAKPFNPDLVDAILKKFIAQYRQKNVGFKHPLGQAIEDDYELNSNEF
ncbi:hypothetical protein AGMMS49959_05660 [Planctomycetales bacterium]|nr:hypothetical protein AGMMS49959_05660 [Planctomycetales bacterium]